MSSNQHVINPTTGRPIKKGGRVYRRLVREGLLKNDDFKDEKELYTIQKEDNIQEKIKELNENTSSNTQVVRGRGKYKGKLVKRNLAPNLDMVCSVLSDDKIYNKLREGNFRDNLERMLYTSVDEVKRTMCSVDDEDDNDTDSGTFTASSSEDDLNISSDDEFFFFD